MKITLTTNEITQHLLADKYANWSDDAAHAIAEYLEQEEEATGASYELDVVAIRCDFHEYPSCLEAAVDYGYEADESDDDEWQEKHAEQWLERRGTVIKFYGGVIFRE